MTRRSVLIADRAADWIIRVGGVAVILAVVLIMAFLVQVVVPLFAGATVQARIEHDFAGEGGVERPLASAIDEHQTIVVALASDGRLAAYHLATGMKLAVSGFDLGAKRATALGRTLAWTDMALGFADGTVRFGRLALGTEVLRADQVPAGLRRLDRRDSTDGQAVYSAIPGGQFRRVSVTTTLEPEQKISDTGAAIVAIDYHLAGTTERPTRTLLTIDAAGHLRLTRAESRTNMMTRQTRTVLATGRLPDLPAGTRVVRALTTDKADQVFIGAEDGTVYRFDTRDLAAPVLAERARLVRGAARLTVLEFLIGEQSLVVGASDGSVDVYFRLQRDGAGGTASTTDGFQMVRAHALEPHGGAVTGFSASQRTKLFVTSDAAGEVWLRHSTSGQTVLKLARAPAPTAGPAGAPASVLLAPRDDGVLAIETDGRGAFWRVSAPHPETTFASLFGRVWYEGYDAPGYTWQSSAGTDSFEPKLSLVPLIFGTLKATLYALLFAVPVALLGAIYTSEFVHARVRATVKPAMEMMASLPSVVLGFIAALILAPIVETWITSVLMALVVTPLALLVAAHLWQMLPREFALKLEGLPKLAFILAALAAAFAASGALAPWFEAWVFAGDFNSWANGERGSGGPVTFLLALPGAYLAVMLGARRVAGDWLKGRDFARWLVFLAAAALLSTLLALALGGLGYDPRGGFVGTYVQRNALIVGFAMGFAVIPIIYTIAEDALNAVPEHLRAAALACGATTWQTATAIILPAAASGIFAAIMIGMGRAVGETMIVVMAAGNTPILDWNLFNGLRALSANIAVELPEAVKDGTLYRTLFLAALTLFIMTFVVNTAAEIVRQRFRRQAAQL